MQVIGSYLVFFATAILGIPGSLAGLAVGISIFWDAVTDPVMGYISDVTHSRRFGRRHLYLIIGSLGIAATVYLIWNIDAHLSSNMKFFLIFIYIILFKTAMTIYTTPYTALGSELSPDYNERTKIQSVKTIFFLVGLALVTVAGMYFFFQPTPEFPRGQLNPHSYRNVGLAAAIAVLLSAAVGYFSTTKYIPKLNAKQIPIAKGDQIGFLFKSLKDALANRAFQAAAFCYLFNNTASALISSIGLHVFTYTFHLTSQHIALIFGIQFLVSILSQPFWAMISRKIDKKPAMNLGLLLCGTGSLFFAFLVLIKGFVPGNPYVFIPYAIFAGFGTGALFTLPLSMVADTIDLDELQSGKRSEGVYFGSLTLFYKTSQAITVPLIGIMLDLIRFDANAPSQTHFTTISLGLLLSLGSLFSFFLAWLSLKPYHLTEAEVNRIQTEIQAREEAAHNL